MLGFQHLPLALTFLLRSLNAFAIASASPPPPPPPVDAGFEFAPELVVCAAPGTGAALRSLLSFSLTFFSAPIPPAARMDANTSSFPPVGFGNGGALTASRLGGSGGGGGPPCEGSGGGGGALPEGNGGGGGALLEGKGGGGGGPPEGGPGIGLATGGKGGGTGAGGTLR